MIQPDNAFRQWRKRLHLSQRDLAKCLGYGIGRISAWDSGVENPPRRVLLAMAAVERGLPPVDLRNAA